MSTLELEYNNVLEKFDTIVSAMSALSQGSARIPSATSRHYWASVLYTRLTGCGISILQLLPRNRLSSLSIEIWDFSAIASLSRNLCECCITYFYLGIDDVDETEWDCRLNVFNIHDCLRRQKMFKLLNAPQEALDGFKNQSSAICNRLMENSFFLSLPEKTRKKCLNAEKLYITSKDDILEKIGFDPAAFWGLYLLWSSHIHSFPIGFYRTGENNRGTGLCNPTDQRHIILALEVCIDFLKSASRGHLKLFPGSDTNITSKGKLALF